MGITLTPHDALSRDILGGQTDDKITVDTGDVSAADALGEGLYRIKAITDCIVRIGDEDLADATGGEDWHEGDTEVRVIRAGQRIAVDPAA